MRTVVFLLAVGLVGCASMPPDVPVRAVCTACELIQSSGICGARPEALTCPEGKELYVINYDKVLEEGEEPILECR